MTAHPHHVRVALADATTRAQFAGLFPGGTGVDPAYAIFAASVGGELCGGFAVKALPDGVTGELHTELRAPCRGAAGLEAWRQLQPLLRARGLRVLSTWFKREDRRVSWTARMLGFRPAGGFYLYALPAP